MAFSSLILQAVITNLADGGVVLLDRQSSEAESGWDSMRDLYLVRNDAAGMDPHVAAAGLAARGTQVSGKTMWVVSRSGRCRAWGIFEIEVVSLGLLSARGMRVRYDAGANSTQGRDILVPGRFIEPNVAAQESQATCDIEFVVTSGPSPSSGSFYTADVGEAVNPPSPWAAATKDSIWESLTDYTYHYPNGWVLMGSSVENLPGLSTVWLVRDRYQFIYAFSP